MPTADGWFNIFRLSDDDPVQPVDDFLAPAEALFGNGDGADWLATTLDQGLAALDAGGIERAVLNVSDQGPNIIRSRSPGIEFGLDACARAEGRLKMVIGIESATNPMEVVRMIQRYGSRDEVVGLGIFPSWIKTDIIDRRLYPIYAACIEAGLFVRVNVGIAGPQWSSRYQDPWMLEDLLVDFPELTVIAAHMGHPWEQLMIRLMMKFPHLFLMTSAYMPKYFAPELVAFMESRRGRGRIVFGTDFPVLPIAKAVEQARQLPISAEAIDDYLGGALCRLIGWE